MSGTGNTPKGCEKVKQGEAAMTKFKQTEIGLIPEDWEVIKLSQAIEINPKRELKKGTIAKKVSMNCLRPFSKKIQSFEIEKYSGGSKFINGDILMARITPCLENGKTAYVDLLGDEEVGFGSTEFLVLSKIKKKTTSNFVYYLSISPKIRVEAIKSMTGTSGRQRVQIDLLKEVNLAIPPLPEQKAIAKILSSLDDKIELLRNQNKTLEAIGQALFKHWFVDFEFPDEEGKPYKSSGGEMVYSEKLEKEIPKGWKWGHLSDLIEEKRIKIMQRKAQVLSAVKTGELVHSEYFFTKRVYSKSINKYLEVKKFDFAYNPARINIGSIGLLKQNILGAVSPVYVVFSCKNHSHFFIEQMLKRPSIKTQIVQFCSGTVRQNLAYEGFQRIKLIVPDKNLFIKYNEFYEKLLLYQKKTKEMIDMLSKTRDSLLPKLMSGEIRVKYKELK